MQSWRRLLAAYDVDRQLERGYTLTLTLDGRLVRGTGGLAGQPEIVTASPTAPCAAGWRRPRPPARAGNVGDEGHEAGGQR